MNGVWVGGSKDENQSHKGDPSRLGFTIHLPFYSICFKNTQKRPSSSEEMNRCQQLSFQMTDRQLGGRQRDRLNCIRTTKRSLSCHRSGSSPLSRSTIFFDEMPEKPHIIRIFFEINAVRQTPRYPQRQSLYKQTSLQRSSPRTQSAVLHPTSSLPFLGSFDQQLITLIYISTSSHLFQAVLSPAKTPAHSDIVGVPADDGRHKKALRSRL